MTQPFDVLIKNPNIEILSEHAPDNNRLFQIEPLKARTNYDHTLVLKIKNDEFTNFEKELESKRDGITVDFKLNVFGNNPLSSLNQASQLENAQ